MTGEPEGLQPRADQQDEEASAASEPSRDSPPAKTPDEEPSTAPASEPLENPAPAWTAPFSAAPSLPGAIHCRGAGREWECLCNGGIESLKQAAMRLGAEVVGESGVSLDEVFVGRVGTRIPSA